MFLKRQEREMRQKLESQDEEVLDFKENFSSLQQEIDYKTRKLRKMYARWQSVRQEMSDLSDEFGRQRRELEETQEVLMKELRLKQLIVSHFVPPDFRRQITSRLRYEEDEEKWMLSPATEMPLLPRGFASKFELRPTSDFEKLARSTEESSSFGRFKVTFSNSPTKTVITNRFFLLVREHFPAEPGYSAEDDEGIRRP